MNTERFKSANISFAVVLFLSMLTLASCKDDDDVIPPAKSGTITVNDQMVSQNKLWIESITMDEDGWVVVHANSGSGPMVPDIISEPVQVSKGTNSDVMVSFSKSASIADGDAVWVMLHDDTGVKGTYEFDGSTGGDDPPLMDAAGNIVMKSIKISAPSIVVSDQAVSSSNTVTIAEVNAAVDGWIVIHNDDGTGKITLPGIIGKTFVEKGMHTDVMIVLDELEYVTGQKMFPMLHIDSPANGEYDFPDNGDGAEKFSFDADQAAVTVVTSFEVLELN